MPEVIAQAAAAGITAVKLYPQGKATPDSSYSNYGQHFTNTFPGVTTNSESGVADLESMYPTFAAMEKHGLGG